MGNDRDCSVIVRGAMWHNKSLHSGEYILYSDNSAGAKDDPLQSNFHAGGGELQRATGAGQVQARAGLFLGVYVAASNAGLSLWRRD